MSRHVIDHARAPADGDRNRKFYEMDRHALMHPAVKALHQRPAVRAEENSRLTAYARIERGIEA